MTEHEHDDVIDLLRQARPEGPPQELVSPHAPAAQALLEEILSMETTQSTETSADAATGEVVDLTATRHRRSGRRWLTLGGAVAAGVAAIVAVGTVVLNPADTTEASAEVDAALARSAASLDRSGRAVVDWRIVHDNARTEPVDIVNSGIDAWEYAGDDWSVSLQYFSFDQDAIPGDVDPINRYVDGELYLYIADRDGQYRWFRDTEHDVSAADGVQVDPGTLLADLDANGDFEEIGEETVDGIRTRRMRATSPRDAEVPSLGGALTQDFLGEVTALEVWVDDDGFVRRLDLAFAGDEEIPDEIRDGVPEVGVAEATVSARFSDFGEPIVIEAPTDAEDFNPVG